MTESPDTRKDAAPDEKKEISLFPKEKGFPSTDPARTRKEEELEKAMKNVKEFIKGIDVQSL